MTQPVVAPLEDKALYSQMLALTQSFGPPAEEIAELHHALSDLMAPGQSVKTLCNILYSLLVMTREPHTIHPILLKYTAFYGKPHQGEALLNAFLETTHKIHARWVHAAHNDNPDNKDEDKQEEDEDKQGHELAPEFNKNLPKPKMR